MYVYIREYKLPEKKENKKTRCNIAITAGAESEI